MEAKSNLELEFRQKWLQWVVDFIQLDLSSLSEMEMKVLACEALYVSSATMAFHDTFENVLVWLGFGRHLQLPIKNINLAEITRLTRQERASNYLTENDSNNKISEIESQLPNIQNALRDIVEKICCTVKEVELPQADQWLELGETSWGG